MAEIHELKYPGEVPSGTPKEPKPEMYVRKWEKLYEGELRTMPPEIIYMYGQLYNSRKIEREWMIMVYGKYPQYFTTNPEG